MQQAAELLTDMHREQQTAVDALEAMFDLLATAASQDASDLVEGVDPRVTLLGNFQRCASLLWCLGIHRSNPNQCTACTCLLGLKGLVVGDVGVVQCLQRYNTWCCYGTRVSGTA